MKWQPIMLVLAFVTSDASAQQQTQTTQVRHMTPEQRARLVQLSHQFPMSADTYERTMVQKALAKARTMRPIGPVTQGDINGGILLMRDCAARIEADGIVTHAEFAYCGQMLANYQHEKLNEIIATSSPDQWKQWMHQSAAANRH